MKRLPDIKNGQGREEIKQAEKMIYDVDRTTFKNQRKNQILRENDVICSENGQN